jgi:cob(I)alamin adenosyltransferase
MPSLWGQECVLIFLMKIYTKKGDAGETGLYGNVRVPKDDSRIRTYGTIDELNACLGLALCEADTQPNLSGRLSRIQGELFQLGAELATPRGKTVPSALIAESHVQTMEKEIDAMEAQLPALRSFILPGGSRLSSLLHFARTVSRRAERELTGLNRAEPCRPEVMRYMNRLSDYLFVTARHANHLAQVTDIPWNPPAK